jgi:long-chain acyl-CoA synthetase
MPLFEAPLPDAIPGEHLPAWIAANARNRPEAIALIYEGAHTSWAEMDRRVSQVANALLGTGLKHGDNVAVLGRNSPEYFELFFGILRAGGCVVPLSTMASSEALERMIVDADCKLLFLSDEMRHLIDPVDAQLNCLLPGGRKAFDFAADGWSDYASWREVASTEDPQVEIAPGDHFNIIYSSGTTGVPKGILHTHAIRVHIAKVLGQMQFTPDSRTLLSTPLYSNTTIVPLLPTVMVGATTVLMHRSNTEAYLHLVEQERCTHTMQVPVQYQRIMAHPDFDKFDLSSMQVKFSTSAPLRAPLKRDILDRFPGLMIEIYGLTEGGGGTTLVCNDHPDKLDTVGQPGMGTELKIIDEDGNEVKQGEIGEIVARSPNMMSGYYGRDDLTDAILWRDKDGKTFFRSGDAGWLDEDGFLHLSDRLKDMILSGGFNIYATDLEVVVGQHPDVTDVAVIGIPSEDWGETPLALVVRRAGSQTTAAEIRDWANERLGKTQRVSDVEFRDELPRSAIGKILKRELRAPYWMQQS